MPILAPSAKPPRPLHPALEPREIVRRLGPLLRPERRRRIDEVLARRLASVTLVIERPYDPHNAAAAMRTAEALGLSHLHIIRGDEGFSFSRKVTISAHKWLDVYVYPDTTSCMARLRGAGFALWAALPPDVKVGKARGLLLRPGAPLPVETPTALCFGNEHEGLTPEAIEACHSSFSLEMLGFTESYNLSVSAALALQLVCAARREYIGQEGDLPPQLISRLRAAYYARSTRHAAEVLMAGLR